MSKAYGRRARRALERQLAYQQRKSERVRGSEAGIVSRMQQRSAAVRDKLAAFGATAHNARVLEVGSGAHGLIFFFEGVEKVGVDPLADEYRALFPAWQGRAQTLRAFGEELPLPDASFDIVLCDNVVDHAGDPRAIAAELVRVLRPDGLLYFTVNIHHPIYHIASILHGAAQALRLPIEIGPFADHTVHLTSRSARSLFAGLPLRTLSAREQRVETRARRLLVRHAGDRLKKFFFKNAKFELIAKRS